MIPLLVKDLEVIRKEMGLDRWEIEVAGAKFRELCGMDADEIEALISKYSARANKKYEVVEFLKRVISAPRVKIETVKKEEPPQEPITYSTSSVMTHDLKPRNFNDGIFFVEGVRVGIAFREAIQGERKNIKELVTGVLYTGVNWSGGVQPSKVTINARMRFVPAYLNYVQDFPGRDLVVELDKTLSRGIEFGRNHGLVSFYYTSAEMLSNAMSTYGFYNLLEPFKWKDVGEEEYGLKFPRKGLTKPRKLMWEPVPDQEVLIELANRREELLIELRRFLGN